MPASSWSSLERLTAALECRPSDHTPCAFMMYKGLKNRCATYMGFLQAQLDLGLDTLVELPARPPLVANDHYNLHGLPVRYHPDVQVREWQQAQDEGPAVLVKEYRTPAGSLRAEVLQSPGWPYGDHLPFLDDQIIPRARRFPVGGPADLPALRYLLQPPTAAERQAYQDESRPYLEFAKRHGLLVAGGWGVGADLVGWICGLKEMIQLSYRQPDFLAELLGLISEWELSRMETVASLPVQLYVKRAWYENCDFWTPAAWRRFLLPHLRREVEQAHRAGVKFGYLVTSKAMPLIESLLEAGVDVLVGVDPRAYDLAALAEKARGRLCLWGGVNGHLTVETGTAEQVEAEVRTAMQTLAPGGGFILSPVDNVRQHSPGIEANVKALIETWEAIR
jgi:hypothetical protein